MIKLREQIARYILENCPKRTDEALMQRFGISYNTLRKIESRKPLRKSLVLRIEQRVGMELR